MAVKSYSAAAHWHFGRQFNKPRFSGTVYLILKELDICKAFRGWRGGIYKQRTINVLVHIESKKVITHGVGVNKLIKVPINNQTCSLPPDHNEVQQIDVVITKRVSQASADEKPGPSTLKTLTENLKYDLPTICNTNVQSLTNKVDELKLRLDLICIYIACLTATWSIEDQSGNVFNINGGA